MNLVKTIRNAVDSDNVILGTKETVRSVITGEADYVVLASNCEEDSRADLLRYAGLADLEVKEFKGTSIELGEVCGKPFVVSMLAVLSKGKESGSETA